MLFSKGIDPSVPVTVFRIAIKHYVVLNNLFKKYENTKVCISNSIQMMLVSFIPDANFSDSIPSIPSTLVVSLYSRKQLFEIPTSQ